MPRHPIVSRRTDVRGGLRGACLALAGVIALAGSSGQSHPTHDSRSAGHVWADAAGARSQRASSPSARPAARAPRTRRLQRARATAGPRARSTRRASATHARTPAKAASARAANRPIDPDAPDRFELVVQDAAGAYALGTPFRWVKMTPRGVTHAGRRDDPAAEAFVEAALRVQSLMKRLGFGGNALERLRYAQNGRALTGITRFNVHPGMQTSPGFMLDVDRDRRTRDSLVSLGQSVPGINVYQVDAYAHEIGHGLTMRLLTPYGLEHDYYGPRQSVALDEHIADVIGMMTNHMREDRASELRGGAYAVRDWNFGEVFSTRMKSIDGVRPALRNFLRPGRAFEGHKVLGDDRQVANWRQRYKGIEADGHLNSGPLNYAFARAVQHFDAPYIDTIGKTWLHALGQLPRDAYVEDFVHAVYRTAGEQFADRPALRARVRASVLHGFREAGFSTTVITRGRAARRAPSQRDRASEAR